MWQRLCDLSVRVLRWFFIGIVVLCLFGLATLPVSLIWAIARGPDWANEWRGIVAVTVVVGFMAWGIWREYGQPELDSWMSRRARAR